MHSCFDVYTFRSVEGERIAFAFGWWCVECCAVVVIKSFVVFYVKHASIDLPTRTLGSYGLRSKVSSVLCLLQRSLDVITPRCSVHSWLLSCATCFSAGPYTLGCLTSVKMGSLDVDYRT
jgi:hypothetical protein